MKIKKENNKMIFKAFFGIIIFLIILITHFYVSPQAFFDAKLFQNPAFSAVTDNVRGFAHSSASQSWVNFNCANDPDLGAQNVFEFNFATSTASTDPIMHFSFPNCLDQDYGLNIDDTTGAITGKVLSDHYGWIDFNHNTNPFEPKAFYNSSTQEITGTAFAESLGDPNGKINFNDVYVSSDGYWHGFMSNSEMGNIKLNCDDSTPTSTHPECTKNFFKVKYIMPLEIQALSAPNWSQAQACSSFANKAILRWEIVGDPQSAYQIIIDTDSVRDDDDPYYDSEKVESISQQFICPSASNAVPCNLNYDTTYYFWVQLWNSVDQARGWVQFDTNEINHTLTDNVEYNNTNSSNPDLSFTTYRHELPEPSFTWDPTEIEIGEDTNFEAEANYYSDTNPNTNSQLCTNSTCDFAWNSTVASDISSTTNATTTIVFTQATDGSVILDVSDSAGYTCSVTEPISVNYETPIWKEVKPEE